jgi:hypothetical protein
MSVYFWISVTNTAKTNLVEREATWCTAIAFDERLNDATLLSPRDRHLGILMADTGGINGAE